RRRRGQRHGEHPPETQPFHGRNGNVRTPGVFTSVMLLMSRLFSPVQHVELGPGAFHLRGYLSLDAQRAVVDECRALIDGAVPAYVPTVRGGGKMHVRMLCLGRHWNGQTYTYEATRTDFDGQPAPALPDGLRALAREIAAAVGMTLQADLCILNYYA